MTQRLHLDVNQCILKAKKYETFNDSPPNERTLAWPFGGSRQAHPKVDFHLLNIENRANFTNHFDQTKKHGTNQQKG